MATRTIRTGHREAAAVKAVSEATFKGKVDRQAAVEKFSEIMGEPSTWNAVASLSGRATRKGAVIEPPDTDEHTQWYGGLMAAYNERTKKRKDLKRDDFFDIAESVQGLKKDVDISSLQVAADAKATKPIALVAMSDLHLGSPACAYDILREHIDLILGDSRFRVLKGGDWADNFNPNFPSAIPVAGQTVSPMLQKLWVEKIMQDMQGQIVAAVGGNHDLMDERKTGISSEYFILRNMPFPYLKYGGLVTLKVGSQYYEILWKHNYQGNSYINPFNSHRRLRMLWGRADICVLEHLHSPATSISEEGGLAVNGSKTAINIRAGAYKQADEFAIDKFRPGIISPTTTVLFPDRKKMVVFTGMDALIDAQTYLNGLEAKGGTKTSSQGIRRTK